MEKLIEMALSRLDAMDRCINYGERFCEHFNIICSEGKQSENFKHHCAELQGWFKTVCKIKTKHNGKALSDEDLTDWFFTAGTTMEDVINKEYISIYKTFVEALLCNKDSNKLISDILEDLI